VKGLPLSHPAAGLVRAISKRANMLCDRILLTDVRSVDWQSLTFTGERHEIVLTLAMPGAGAAAQGLIDALEREEFSIPGHIVADIAGKLLNEDENGSVSVAIEALTIAE
jgi:hypothetical protein